MLNDYLTIDVRNFAKIFRVGFGCRICIRIYVYQRREGESPLKIIEISSLDVSSIERNGKKKEIWPFCHPASLHAARSSYLRTYVVYRIVGRYAYGSDGLPCLALLCIPAFGWQ